MSSTAGWNGSDFARRAGEFRHGVMTGKVEVLKRAPLSPFYSVRPGRESACRAGFSRCLAGGAAQVPSDAMLKSPHDECSCREDGRGLFIRPEGGGWGGVLSACGKASGGLHAGFRHSFPGCFPGRRRKAFFRRGFPEKNGDELEGVRPRMLPSGRNYFQLSMLQCLTRSRSSAALPSLKRSRVPTR